MINALALSHARTQRGLSQRKLAQLVGLNYQVIRRLEAGGNDGNLTLRDLDKICTTLAVPPVELLGSPSSVSIPAQADSAEADVELDVAQARLLRRIQRDSDVRKSLTTDQRQLVLPGLLHLDLVRTARSGALRLTPQGRTELDTPDPNDAWQPSSQDVPDGA